MMNDSKTNKPKTIRDGSVVVSIFENSTDRGVRYSVSVTRIFKRDESSEWERSSSLNGDDCLRAAELLREASRYIRDQRQAD